MKQLPLKTERLILRPFRADDARRIAELAGDEVIADTTLRIPHPYTEEMAGEWIGTHAALREKGIALFYAIELRENGELVGGVGIDIDSAHERTELGYWIGRDFWGSGYATESAARLLAHAFGELDLHKVTAKYFTRNPASGRILEKIGMKREGLLREHIRKSGSWEDINQYGILDYEYEAASAQKGK